MSFAVHFHFATPRGIVLSQMAEVNDLPELREYAQRFIRKLISAPTLEDWRNWVLHVSDDMNKELFAMPFASLLGKPH
jgi:hypothetical protein